MKSAPSPTHSIAARIGNGRKTMAQRLRTAGSPKADFSNTVGKATMRRAAVYPGAGLADSSAARELLCRMDVDLPVGTLLRI